MSKRMVALLLALVMLLGLLPAGALAAEPENGSLGTVRVIVENMTAKKGQDLGTVGTCPVSYTHLTLPTNREVLISVDDIQ